MKAFTFGLFVAVSVVMVGCGGDNKEAKKQVHLGIGADFLHSANTAIEAGDYMTACVNVGIAKQAALQSGDKDAYKTTYDIEKKVCKIAGLDR
jgi:hypothetical protein